MALKMEKKLIQVLGKCVQMDQCVQDRKQNCRHSVFGKFPEKGTVKAWKQWRYKEEGG